MADDDKRRQLRRKKILENAEDRKNRIFGQNRVLDHENSGRPTNLSSNNEVHINECLVKEVTKNPVLIHPTIDSVILGEDRTNGVDKFPEELERDWSNTAKVEDNKGPENFHRTFNQKPTREHQSIGLTPQINDVRSLPNFTEQIMNLSQMMNSTNGGYISPSRAPDISPGVIKLSLNHPLVPIILAIVVCSLLSLNLGYLVHWSVATPFLVWEAQRLWQNWTSMKTSARAGGSSLLNMALILCGIPQATVTLYTQIFCVMMCFMDDFGLYIFAVVFWQLTVGLPMLNSA